MRLTAVAAVVVVLAMLVSGCNRATTPTDTPVATTGTPKAPAVELLVFAGAASKPALEELAKAYETEGNARVAVTFGGSGSVLTQFSQEHFGDVYVPGSDDFMDRAEKKGAVLADSRKALVYLVPTICVAKGNPKGIKGLADLSRKDLRVVLGEPKAVCLGDIAIEILTAEGLWDKVKPHVANYASSCENVLQNLLLGEADVAIGWDVFARQHPDKVESIALPAKLARPRNIPAAVITWSKQPEAARKFIDFLASEASKAVWEKHGYTTEAPAAPAGGDAGS